MTNETDPKKYLFELSQQQKFASKIDMNGPIPPHAPHLGRCWIWAAGKFWCGYGCFTYFRKTWYCHRLSYHIFVGEIPTKIQVLHKCDNRLCVNPEHLFLGTNKDNVDDKIKKGRNTHQSGKKWAEFIRSVQPRGEKSKCAKLTDDQVKEMRKAYVKGSSTNGTTALSKRYKVPCSHVWSIVNRKAWVHI